MKSVIRGLLLAGLCLSAQPSRAELDGYLIDVRTPQEYQQEHVEGALNMPYDQIDKLIDGKITDKDTPIMLYCKSGGRAGKAKTTLEELGYKHVENLGGLEDAKKRFPEKAAE